MRALSLVAVCGLWVALATGCGGGGPKSQPSPPVITGQPQSRSVTLGQAATFTVTAAGDAPLAYQWRKGGSALTAGTAATYQIAATTTGDAGTYDCLVTNGVGSATSQGATLTVVVPPTITTQPQAHTANAGDTVQFTVLATGSSPMHYAWKKGTTAVGLDAATLTLTNVGTSDAGSYSVTVSNTAGQDVSTSALLTVNGPPYFTVQPQNLVLGVGASGSFNANASGPGTVTYQWRKGGVAIGGATGTSYAITNADKTMEGNYDVVASNAYGNTPSQVASLLVGPPDYWVEAVYLTQSTQNLAGNVPLVAGKPGLVRVFLRANATNTWAPSVRIRLYQGGSTVLDQTVTSPVGAISTAAPDESSLSNSWNVAVAANLIQPGVQILVQADPAGAITDPDKTNNVWPAGGSPGTLDVRSLPTFKVVFFPVQTGDGRVGAVTSGDLSAFGSLLERAWPVADSPTRTLGSTFTTSQTTLTSDSTAWSKVLSELYAKRSADKVTDAYYYGVVNPNYSSGIAGLGYVGAPTAIGWDKSSGYSDSGLRSGVFAHEVGHNFGLDHAPCGSVGSSDPSYPYTGGFIGAWGYDAVANTLKSPSTFHDIMGYCSSIWGSDYNYKKVLTSRLGGSVPVVVPDEASRLLVWGRLEGGQAILEPAFELPGGGSVPEAGDEWVEAFDAQGVSLFRVSFSLMAIGCGSDGRHFALDIPLEPGQADRIDRLVWSHADGMRAQQVKGPAAARVGALTPSVRRMAEGQSQVTWDADQVPVVMVRDRATGEVLGFGRGGRLQLPVDTSRLELHLSHGVGSRKVVP